MGIAKEVGSKKKLIIYTVLRRQFSLINLFKNFESVPSHFSVVNSFNLPEML